MIGLDHFKQVNDERGHNVGDRASQRSTMRFGADTRILDTVARYGGEEFAVVTRATDHAEAADAGERLRAAVEAQRCEPQVGYCGGLTGTIGPRQPKPAPEARRLTAGQMPCDAKRKGRHQVAHAPMA